MLLGNVKQSPAGKGGEESGILQVPGAMAGIQEQNRRSGAGLGRAMLNLPSTCDTETLGSGQLTAGSAAWSQTCSVSPKLAAYILIHLSLLFHLRVTPLYLF